MKSNKRKKQSKAFMCSMLGTVILVLVIVICAPITLPRIFGYQVYSVVSGSMEPAIKTGSLVYIKYVEPEQIQTDEVIAYYGSRDENAIVTHRVVENRVIMGEFITKGDSNQTEDMNPVSYNNYIGRITLTIPQLGSVSQAFTSLPGKIAAGCAIGIAVLLHGLAASVYKKE